MDSGGRSPADTMLGSESHVEVTDLKKSRQTVCHNPLQLSTLFKQVDNRTGEKLIFRRSGMALPPVLGQDTDSDAGAD